MASVAVIVPFVVHASKMLFEFTGNYRKIIRQNCKSKIELDINVVEFVAVTDPEGYAKGVICHCQLRCLWIPRSDQVLRFFNSEHKPVCFFTA